MREGEIASAALDVDPHSQVIQGNGGALDVPTGSTVPESGVPGRLLRACRLPQQAIEWVTFAGAARISTTFSKDADHFRLFEVRNGAESRVTAH